MCRSLSDYRGEAGLSDRSGRPAQDVARYQEERLQQGSTMKRQIFYSAIIFLVLSTTTHAHEPVGRRLIREYQQQNARLQAEKERQRKRWEQWEKDWKRQERVRQETLTPRITVVSGNSYMALKGSEK